MSPIVLASAMTLAVSSFFFAMNFSSASPEGRWPMSWRKVSSVRVGIFFASIILSFEGPASEPSTT